MLFKALPWRSMPMKKSFSALTTTLLVASDLSGTFWDKNRKTSDDIELHNLFYLQKL